MKDAWNLQRFLDAQEDVYGAVCAELRQGRKRSHWMWFIFPQIQGLGYSEMSRRYAISSREEALAYLAHPVLGARLRECTQRLLQIEGRSALVILGSPDDQKFQSSMSLFGAVSDEPIFSAALKKFFDSRADSNTLVRL